MGRTIRARLGYITAMAMMGVASPGCGGGGDGLPREPISGAVTLDGQPLKAGSIQFSPLSETQGTPAGGMITDGAFKVPREEGPVPGSYKVMINSRGAETPLPEGHTPGAPKPLPKDLIPRRYNMKTALTAEVKAGGPNTFTFDLMTK